MCTASPSNTNNGVGVSPPQSGSSYSTITAQSPAVGPSGVGTNYVQVEVENLYSAFEYGPVGFGLSAPEFTYSVLVPIVTSVGAENNGSITINGYNFDNGVTVGFCQQNCHSSLLQHVLRWIRGRWDRR